MSGRVRARAAAHATGLSLRAIQAMAARGQVPGAGKFGRVWTFDARKLEVWIAAREETACPEARTFIGVAASGGRASRLPGATCDAAYAQAIGLSRKNG
jgi:hypothetical protein